jgi:hypothetical protein
MLEFGKQLKVLDACMKDNVPADVLANLPGLLIIGVAKGGTTSLFENLSMHPQICRPNDKKNVNPDDAMNKELRFFWRQNYYKRGAEFYASFFPERKNGEIFMEATTSYIWLPCQKRIQALLPDVKAILMLRNPTYRAWSHYWTFFSREPYYLPLSCFWNVEHQIIRRGIYIDQIKRWYEYFDRENLLIIKSEDYFGNEKMILGQIYRFLGIEEIYPELISRRDPWNERKKAWGYPEIPPDVKKWLDEFYGPHNEALSIYLNRDFLWWRVG